MTKRAIPSSMKIGATTWKVELVERELRDHEAFGECDITHKRLLIASELGDDQQEITFVHELLHAACYFAGIQGRIDEEELVTRLAPVLHTVLVENGFWKVRK